jgi:hypothetical protein
MATYTRAEQIRENMSKRLTSENLGLGGEAVTILGYTVEPCATADGTWFLFAHVPYVYPVSGPGVQRVVLLATYDREVLLEAVQEVGLRVEVREESSATESELYVKLSILEDGPRKRNVYALWRAAKEANAAAAQGEPAA